MAAIIPMVTKLSNRVIRILGCNPGPMTLQGTNTYLIGTGEGRVLLDTGEQNIVAYQKNLLTVLEEEKIKIDHIVLTHWHHDHIGGLEDIYFGPICSKPKVWKFKRDANDLPDELPPRIPINWLEEGQEIKVEGATIKIHHTPGHTTDHVCVGLKEDLILFSGDCVLGEGTAVFEDLYTYMKSLNKILDLQPLKIYPGHGNVIEDPKCVIEYYINHRNEREKQILDKMYRHRDQHFTELQLVQMIYTDTPEYLWQAAAVNVGHHLQKLEKEKKVKKQAELLVNKGSGKKILCTKKGKDISIYNYVVQGYRPVKISFQV